MSTATETYADATIVGSTKELSKIVVEETESGTIFEVTQSANKLRFSVNDGGFVETTGERINNARFTFSGGGEIEITNDIVSNTRVTGSDAGDTLTVGGSTVKNLRIDLGDQDGEEDIVEFEDLESAKGVRIDNFGDEDKLIINGAEFDKATLQAYPFKNITIKFD